VADRVVQGSRGIRFVLIQVGRKLGGKTALSVPKCAGRIGLYKSPLQLALGFVEAARFLGGQPFANTVDI
jgi:hypothetical protein